MLSKKPIILFKTPSPSSALDPYNKILSSTSYDPTFIPVLEETYSIDDLQPILKAGPSRYEGVIITSRRGAEGWNRAVNHHVSLHASRKGKEKQKEINDNEDDDQGNWSNIPLFTVGTASTDHINRSQLPVEYTPHPVQYHDGIPPKSAIHLIPYILNKPPRIKDQGGYKPYLFVRGDKSTDLLQDQLKENQREIEEIMVYKTSPRNDIIENLRLLQSDKLSKGSDADPDADTDTDTDRIKLEKGWLCFFSPSGAEVVVPLLGMNGENADGLPENNDDQKAWNGPIGGLDEHNGNDHKQAESNWDGWKIFVIGETTRKWFEEKGLKVDAVADQPNPEGLLECIQAFDTSFIKV
ncbi:uncharacterized protein L201_000400 [Kwoniella dendrophila CBS 6074]|uniref:Tetrapyrrole biosynthesis uroporphyrinogen III synthase domain-containing protein n=1 Tax=Kwoniella dendrophila CBS 6074 TaxID=1295534 RepID=A0AAX4JKL5_9TREE